MATATQLVEFGEKSTILTEESNQSDILSDPESYNDEPTIDNRSDLSFDCDSISTLNKSASTRSISLLQSTPRVGPLSTPQSLPSTAKSLQPSNSSQKRFPRGIMSILTSIAEKSPLKLMQRHSIALGKAPVETEPPKPSNNNDYGTSNNNLEETSRPTPDSIGNDVLFDEAAETDGHFHCSCADCKAAVRREMIDDKGSETSYSIMSLFSQETKSGTFSDDEHFDLNDFDETYQAYGETPTPNRNSIGNRFQHLNKILQSTLAAGRKSIGNHLSPKDSPTGGTESRMSTLRKSWTTRTNSRARRTMEVPELLGTYKQKASPSSRRSSFLSTASNRSYFDRDPYRSNNTSIDSIMVVLVPAGTATRRRTETEVFVEDPLLKQYLEELKREMSNQEIISKQASKALDECGKLMRRATNGIVFAEKVLHVASERFHMAEHELLRLIDGGDFEPQLDRVIIQKIYIDLCSEFVKTLASSGKQYIFLILLKYGHHVESSAIVRPEIGKGTLVVEKIDRDVNEKSPDTNFVLTFNRGNWDFDLEVYSVFTKRPRENVLHLNRRRSKKKESSLESLPTGVRKTSFGLLAKATITKEDICAGRAVELQNTASVSPLKTTFKLDGEASLCRLVSFESYLGVKDYHGVFGGQGRMKTFKAKLTNARLEFYEVSESSREMAVPLHTFDLKSLKPTDIQKETFNSTYFHDFTLKLGESQEEWLNLCTNSREDTANWIGKIQESIAPPIILKL